MKEYRLHGPPGTGKTRALSQSWVPKAAEKFGGRNVVICSLTKTAAKEIASRDLPIPQDNVGTLHALCYRALGRPPIAEANLDHWNEEEPGLALGGAQMSVDMPEMKKDRATTGDLLAARAQVLRHNQVTMERWPEDVSVFQRRWDDWCLKHGYLDFTGMIEQALAEVPVAPNNPAVFVVDEAQDCSVLELALVREWGKSAEYTVLAGDGDQAIYGWRGASARAFLGTEIPEEHNYKLTKSYRVPRAVHALADRWIRQASYRYAVDYEPRDFEGEVTTCRGSSRAIEPVYESILADLSEGKTVMVLATCGYMLRPLQAILRREGILFHNPYRPSHGGWNPLRGGVGRLLSYLRPDPVTFPDLPRRMWSWEEAAVWTEVLKAKETMARSGKSYIKSMADSGETLRQIITDGDGRAVFGEHWDTLVSMFESGEDPLPWFSQRVLGSKVSLMDYAMSIANKHGRPALRSDPRLIIGTMHSVKGGQADSVYLFPDLSPSSMREWMGSGEGKDGVIRTFYVGMTRAKEKLVLCNRWSPSSVAWQIER